MFSSQCPSLIERSELYNIAPIGDGSIFSESITSYLIRLSGEHCLHVGELMSKLIAPRLEKEYLLASNIGGGNRFYDIAKTLNGYLENATDFVQVLQALTSRKGLENLTLFPLKNVIPVRGLLRESLAWCPECLNKWDKNGIPYYPLLWFLNDVEICPDHVLKLCSECPECKGKVPVLHRKSLIGYCPYCCAWLGSSNPERDIHENDHNVWISINIGDLLAYNSTTKENIDRERHSIILTSIKDKMFDGNSARFAKEINIPKSTLVGWINGNAIPPLLSQLQLCYQFDISLTDFLTKDNLHIDRVSTDQKSLFVEKKVINKKQHDYDFLEKKLKEVIEQNSAFSMEEVARRIGVNKRLLYRHFPELCYQISSKYREYLASKKEDRVLVAIEKVKKAVKNLLEQGIYPSRRKVEKYLNSPGILKEKAVKDIWHSLLD